MTTKKSLNISPTIENRSAKYNYFVEDTYIAGIVLSGPEVIAIRQGKCNLKDSWCFINENNEIYVKNMYISNTNLANNSFVKYNEIADRKLLLHKSEINKLSKLIDNSGKTIIPLKLYRADNGYFKMLIGICTGKKQYDKRNVIKERDANKEIMQAIKHF